MTNITILKPKEMASVLRLSIENFHWFLRANPDMPMLNIGGIKRFSKEKVLRYIELKKKIDCVPMNPMPNLIMKTGVISHLRS